MKFGKILVVESRKVTENHLDSVRNVREILDRRDVNYTWISYDDLSKGFFDDVDLVVTIGGDGVFIRVSHFVRDTPLLGINSDEDTSEGALKEISGKDLKCFEEILDGNFDVVQRTRARVVRNGELVKELAINEVYVGVENQFHTSRYTIEHEGQEEEQRSSGVLIATGTGSSAWYNSAGGEKFDASGNSLKFIVRELFSARLFRPRILHGEISGEKEIVLKSKRKDGGVIAIDGAIVYPFNSDDEIRIRVCSQRLNVIVPRK